VPEPAAQQAPPQLVARSTAGEVLSRLLQQVDAAAISWDGLRDAVASLADDLDDARRGLREAKEQLSVAHADNDQLQLRLRALEHEVAESRAAAAEARTRLQDALALLTARDGSGGFGSPTPGEVRTPIEPLDQGIARD
jgi:chromosome segregation ATPase